MPRISVLLLLALLGISAAKPGGLRRQLETAAPSDETTFFNTADGSEDNTPAPEEPEDNTVAPEEPIEVPEPKETEAPTVEYDENLDTDAPSEVDEPIETEPPTQEYDEDQDTDAPVSEDSKDERPEHPPREDSKDSKDEETPPPTEEGTTPHLSLPEAKDEHGNPTIPEPDLDFVPGNPDTRNNDLTMTDGEDVFYINTKVTVKYFEGIGGRLEGEKLDKFNELLVALEYGQLLESDFGGGVAKYEMVGLKQNWDEEEQTLTLHFESRVELLPGFGEGQSEHRIAKELAKSDFKEHIKTLRENEHGGIEEFIFTCTGHTRR